MIPKKYVISVIVLLSGVLSVIALLTRVLNYRGLFMFVFPLIILIIIVISKKEVTQDKYFLRMLRTRRFKDKKSKERKIRAEV